MQARSITHDAIALAYREPFNAHLRSLPQDTLQERQALCRAANEHLRELGLAVRCPRTGEASMLQVDTDRSNASGRFRIVTLAAPRTKSMSSLTLPAVELVRRPDRREPFAEKWQDVVHRRGRGEPRK